MAVAATIDVNGLEKLRAALAEMPLQAMRAAKRANRKAATYAEGRFAKHLSAKSGIPQNILRSHEERGRKVGRVRTYLSDDGPGAYKVWLGYNPLKAAYIGNLKADESGAWAREYYWAGAFIAQFASGHRGIFKRGTTRTASGRLALVEQVVMFPYGTEIADAVATETLDRLGTLIDQELKYEMSKANG
jgi:hypothetical protein